MAYQFAVIFLLFFGTTCSSVLPIVDARTPHERGCVASTWQDQPQKYEDEAFVPPVGSLVLREKQSGSIFSMRGEAFSGPLASQKLKLRQFPGVTMYWFAYSAFYPGSEIWGRAERVNDGVLPKNKSGKRGCFTGKDCIPFIGTPTSTIQWAKPNSDGADYLADSDSIVGVAYHGEARAYPRNILWTHEIANDKIGNTCFSVTNCPLVGANVVFDGSKHTFGVGGNLFNSNLVMYDHQTDTLWPQLYMGGVQGPAKGSWLTQLPMTETTWGNWKKLYPQTVVISKQTRPGFDYSRYPYGDYRTDNEDTFGDTDPPADPKYSKKTWAFALVDQPKKMAKAYVSTDIEAKVGTLAAINDIFNGVPVVIVYERPASSGLPPQWAVAFERPTIDGKILEFDAAKWAPRPQY